MICARDIGAPLWLVVMLKILLVAMGPVAGRGLRIWGHFLRSGAARIAPNCARRRNAPVPGRSSAAGLPAG